MYITEMIWFGFMNWKTTIVNPLQGSPQHQPRTYWRGWGLSQTGHLWFLWVGKEENLLGEHGSSLGLLLALTRGAARTSDKAGGLPQQGGSSATTGTSDRTGFSWSMDTQSVLEPTWRRKTLENNWEPSKTSVQQRYERLQGICSHKYVRTGQ